MCFKKRRERKSKAARVVWDVNPLYGRGSMGEGDYELFNTDKNHVYGTYSRGWEEGGEYGDGDRVYAVDENVYYVRNADYERQGKEADWAHDNNSNFDPDD